MNSLLLSLHSVGETLYVGKNRPRHEANNWPTCVFEMEHFWGYISIPYALTASSLLRYRKSFTFRRTVQDTYDVELCLVTLSPWKFDSTFHLNIPTQQVRDSGLLKFSAVYSAIWLSCLGAKRLLSSLLCFRFESKESEIQSSFQYLLLTQRLHTVLFQTAAR